VHRDLKPENLFIERRDNGRECAKILDFGVVQTSGGNSTAHTGSLIGTLRYMAPEQARGDARLDPRADLYALGAILYECLTGVVPHPGRNTEEVLFHIMTQDPTPLRDLRSTLDPSLEAAVLRSLRRNLEERFQSADELADALTPYAGESTAGFSTAASLAARDDTRAEETLINSSAADLRRRQMSNAQATKRRFAWLAVTLLGGLALHFLDRAWLLKAAVDAEKIGTSALICAPKSSAPEAPQAPPGYTTSVVPANAVPVFSVATAAPHSATQPRKNALRPSASAQSASAQSNEYGANLDWQNPYGSAGTTK
jgi:serine/threonine protein kinase